MDRHGGKTNSALPIRKCIPILARKINHLLVYPSQLRLAISELLQVIRKKPHSKFSMTGTMNTLKPKNLICEIKFGSHLYGTATPTSDEDFKGIFLPSVEDILLGRIPKTASSSPRDDSRKNLAGELDTEYYSLHHFLRLATQGQTVTIDMLFAPENMVYKDPTYGWIWDRIVAERQRLLSKQMNAFVGYARGQASKYSLKGERLNKLTAFEEVLDSVGLGPHGCMEYATLADLWDKLPKDDERTNPQGIRELQISGKWYGESTSVANVLVSVNKLLKQYGKRAHASADADGVDWKALSHAVRVSKELIEILSFGRVNFPLVDAPLLLEIKKGERPLEEVQNILDRDLAFVELQAKRSHLPDSIDCKWWDDWLVKVMEDYVRMERQVGSIH